jgi:hypothetical protein
MCYLKTYTDLVTACQILRFQTVTDGCIIAQPATRLLFISNRGTLQECI